MNATTSAAPAIGTRPRPVPAPLLSQRAREAFAVGALVALVASGAAIAICAAGGTSFVVPSSHAGLPTWLAGPLHGLAPVMTAKQFFLALGFMVVVYAALLVVGGVLPVRWVVGAIVLMHVLFAICPPIVSKDIFSYISYARLGVLHGADPYSTGAFQYPGDAAFPYLGWRHVGSAYGPLFTIGTYPLAVVGVPAAMWIIKIVTAVLSLGLVRLVWDCAKRLGREPLQAIIWVGLNPLLLVYGVGGGHNDLIMLFLMMVAVALVLIPRERAGAATVVAAAAVKASALVMIPFLLLRSRDRRNSLIGTVGAAVGLLAISALAFSGHALGVASVLKRQQLLVSADAIPAQLAKAVGLAGVTSDVRLVARLTTFIALGYIAWRVWRGLTDWLDATGWGMITLAITSSWLLGWYIFWPLPFAALSNDRRLRVATCALLVYFMAMRWTAFIK